MMSSPSSTDLDGGHIAVQGGAVVGDALAGAALQPVILIARAAAIARLGDGQQGCAGAHDRHADHLVGGAVFLLRQRDGAHPAGGAPERPGVGLAEADGHALAGGDDQLVLPAGQADPAPARPPRRGSMAMRPPLRAVLIRARERVRLMMPCRVTMHRYLSSSNSDTRIMAVTFSSPSMRQEVDNVHPLGGTAALRHLVGTSAGRPGPRLVKKRT